MSRWMVKLHGETHCTPDEARVPELAVLQTFDSSGVKPNASAAVRHWFWLRLRRSVKTPSLRLKLSLVSEHGGCFGVCNTRWGIIDDREFIEPHG